VGILGKLKSSANRLSFDRGPDTLPVNVVKCVIRPPVIGNERIVSLEFLDKSFVETRNGSGCHHIFILFL
jgi:hypothetical protein